MNNFYYQTGPLILGTRMKRLSEKFLQEINLVYKEEAIAFEPSWFPIFYLLKNGEERSLTDISLDLEVSHSAVSQMVTILKKHGLVNELPDPLDKRRKNIRLSEEGKILLKKVKPVWWAMEQSVKEILGEKDTEKFFKQLRELETGCANNKLSKKIRASIPSSDYDFKLVEDPAGDPQFGSFLSQNRLALDSNTNFFAKVIQQQEIIGLIGVQKKETEHIVYLNEIYILNGFRRKGIGGKLLLWSMNQLGSNKNEGCLYLQKVSIPLIHLLLKNAWTFKVIGHNN